MAGIVPYDEYLQKEQWVKRARPLVDNPQLDRTQLARHVGSRAGILSYARLVMRRFSPNQPHLDDLKQIMTLGESIQSSGNGVTVEVSGLQQLERLGGKVKLQLYIQPLLTDEDVVRINRLMLWQAYMNAMMIQGVCPHFCFCLKTFFTSPGDSLGGDSTEDEHKQPTALEQRCFDVVEHFPYDKLSGFFVSLEERADKYGGPPLKSVEETLKWTLQVMYALMRLHTLMDDFEFDPQSVGVLWLGKEVSLYHDNLPKGYGLKINQLVVLSRPRCSRKELPLTYWDSMLVLQKYVAEQVKDRDVNAVFEEMVALEEQLSSLDPSTIFDWFRQCVYDVRSDLFDPAVTLENADLVGSVRRMAEQDSPLFTKRVIQYMNRIQQVDWARIRPQDVLGSDLQAKLKHHVQSK